MNAAEISNRKTSHMVLCGMFTTLIAVGAFIKIPIPLIPFTLQYLFTMLAGILLGPKLGSLSVWVYILLGLAGLPIFAQGGGLGYMLKPSFGYLPGFLLGTYLTGRICQKTSHPSFFRLLCAGLVGLMAVYGLGMAYYWLITTYYLGISLPLFQLFLYGFLLAIPGDLLLCMLAATVGKRLVPILRKEGL